MCRTISLVEPIAMQLKADVVILFEIQSINNTRTADTLSMMVSQENVRTVGFPNLLTAHQHLNRQVLAVLDGLFNHIFKGHPLTAVGVRMSLKLISGWYGWNVGHSHVP